MTTEEHWKFCCDRFGLEDTPAAREAFYHGARHTLTEVVATMNSPQVLAVTTHRLNQELFDFSLDSVRAELAACERAAAERAAAETPA